MSNPQAPSAAAPPSGPGASPASEFRRGLLDSLPLQVGFAPVALVLGARAAERGLGLLSVSLLTGLNFAGGSEFAALRVWTHPPDVLLIVAMTLLINSRHILLGAALAPLMRHLPRRRALAALFLMSDESWALAYGDAQRHSRPLISTLYYLGAAAGLYVSWVGCATLGARLGPLVGDPRRYGFDMAFVAVFLLLLRSMWQGRRTARPWLVSLFCAGLLSHVLAGPWYLPIGAGAGVLSALWWSFRDGV